MKKIVSLVIVITMMLCMFPVSSMTASATTTEFKGLVDLSNYTDGDTFKRTENGKTVEYMVVKDVSTFKKIYQTDTNHTNPLPLDGKYILANDINLGGSTYYTGLFGNSSSFAGIIDGNGFSIYNFSTQNTHAKAVAGLIAQSLMGGAAIKNLTIGGPKAEDHITYRITNTAATVGALAGAINEASTSEQTVTISNVHIYCNITYELSQNGNVLIGGLIGTTDTNNDAASVVISDCSFTGSISDTSGATYSEKNTRVGGMVGDHAYGSLNISNSINNANIDIAYRTGGDYTVACAGGMVGRVNATASISGQNTGSISINEYNGGIVGYVNAQTSFTNCSNSGNLTTGTHNGGIVGYANAQTGFDGCSNSGTVSATSYSGGIIGFTTVKSDFDYCVNSGNITSVKFSGGIAGGMDLAYGDASTPYTFENCVNHGDIAATGADEKAYAGGILGLANFGTYTFTNCGNTGDISTNFINDSTLCASGILGRYWLNNTDTSITNCYSTGVISSSSSEQFTIYAICNGAGSGNAITVKNCVWNNADYKGTFGTLTEVSGNNEAKNILAKETANDFEACVQKSNDNTKIRVLILSNSATLPANNDVVIKVWYDTGSEEFDGRQFIISASEIFALESVDAAGETYYGVGGAYIFGAVVTGIPTDVMETVTDVTVEYGNYSANFDMTK